MVQGGIYVAKGEDPFNDYYDGKYNVYLGRGMCMIFNDMCCVDNDVEIGGDHNYDEVKGYSFGISIRDKEWHVKDTGHKGCKHILAKGPYGEGMEQSVKKFQRNMWGGNGKSTYVPKQKEVTVPKKIDVQLKLFEVA